MTGGLVEFIANLNVRYVVAIALVLTVMRLGFCFNASPAARGFAEFCESLAMAAVIVFMIIRPFAIQAFYIPSESMVPTLLVNDRIMVDKMSYRLHSPAVGDIVVFKAPKVADPTEVEFIKRCVGVEGDVVEVRKGYVYRNGKQIDEPFIADAPNYDMKIVDGKVYRTDARDPGYYENQVPIVDLAMINHIASAKPEAVPKGCLLMFGDNRNNSNDGHMWGFVPLNRVVGRAWLRFWPLFRIGVVK